MVNHLFIAGVVLAFTLTATDSNADPQPEPMLVPPVSPACISSPFGPRVLANHPQAGQLELLGCRSPGRQDPRDHHRPAQRVPRDRQGRHRRSPVPPGRKARPGWLARLDQRGHLVRAVLDRPDPLAPQVRAALDRQDPLARRARRVWLARPVRLAWLVRLVWRVRPAWLARSAQRTS
jgi:hypothetical protein